MAKKMIKQELFDFKKTFDKKLKNYFDEKILMAKGSLETSEQMLSILKDFTLRGGKRIRPALAYYSYLCFRDDNLDEMLKTGIAVELVQSFLLIHDDIIDNDKLRRGKPTVHEIYSKYFNDKHLGVSLAIIAGDLAISMVYELMMDLNFKAEKKVESASLLSKILNNVSLGQELDVISSKDKFICEEKLLLIHKLKTAMYTFEASLKVGAILGDASKTDLDILESYAIPIGQAFQLQDDIIGLFGDEKTIGKDIGSDLREGKKTLLIIKAKETANKDQKIFLENVLGNKDISLSDINKVRKIIINSGSLEYSKMKIEKLIHQGRKAIENADFRSEGKRFLLDLAVYLKNRSY